MPRQTWTIVSGPEFRRVEAALRKADATLPAEFRNEIRRVANVLAEEARQKVQKLPTPANAGHTGLRRRVARGVGVQPTPSGARITTSMSDPSESIIPMGLDRAKGWRHPVFGNKNVWVQQPGYSWFRETIADGRDDFANRIQEVLQEARDNIAAAGGNH